MRVGEIFSRFTGFGSGSQNYRNAQHLYRFFIPPKNTKISYSQFGEDLLLANLFKGLTGTYVDVGSGHPKRGSNTYSLYKSGWSGITIDPIQRNFRLARRSRPRDRQIHALCSFSLSELIFYEFDPYELSTLSRERVAELSTLGIRPKTVKSIPSITLKSLGVSASPSEPTVLTIDVEGAELDVLNGNDWSNFTPSVICVEEWQSPLEGCQTLMDYLKPLGYLLKARSGLSSFYIHENSMLDWT